MACCVSGFEAVVERAMFTIRLSEMVHGQEGDFFALMTAKEPLTTRDGKPYFRVGFRDAGREVVFPIWQDSAWAVDCRDAWTPGEFYKVRATYRDTDYGPQLEIKRIRPVTDEDRARGFDPLMCSPQSRFDREAMFRDLRSLAAEHIESPALRGLVTRILDRYREELLLLPAATGNHHAFVGGYLEHVLSVSQTCVYLAEKYAALYPDLDPPLDKGLVIAGGLLHDVGKLRELQQRPEGARYTAAGRLIGHMLQGRDIVREEAAGLEIDPEVLLRLEHIIISHQRLPEWGAPKPPMTPEALLVHYADDADAKFQIVCEALRGAPAGEEFTSSRNPLRERFYRGGRGEVDGSKGPG